MAHMYNIHSPAPTTKTRADESADPSGRSAVVVNLEKETGSNSPMGKAPVSFAKGVGRLSNVKSEARGSNVASMSCESSREVRMIVGLVPAAAPPSPTAAHLPWLLLRRHRHCYSFQKPISFPWFRLAFHKRW